MLTRIGPQNGRRAMSSDTAPIFIRMERRARYLSRQSGFVGRGRPVFFALQSKSVDNDDPDQRSSDDTDDNRDDNDSDTSHVVALVALGNVTLVTKRRQPNDCEVRGRSLAPQWVRHDARVLARIARLGVHNHQQLALGGKIVAWSNKQRLSLLEPIKARPASYAWGHAFEDSSFTLCCDLLPRRLRKRWRPWIKTQAKNGNAQYRNVPENNFDPQI